MPGRSPAKETRSRRPPSALVALPLLLAVATAALPGLSERAERELAELDRYAGTERSREALLERNLQDYFAVYKAPADPDEFSRLVRALESIETEFADGLTRQAAGGGDRVDAAEIDAARAARMPSAWDEEAGLQIFFPAAPLADQVPVEPIDLQAMRDTGVPWTAIRAIGAPTGGGDLPAVDDDAVEALAAAVTDHALLVLRIGGSLAREALDSQLRPAHLRAAAKEIPRRAAARGKAQPPPAPERGTFFTDVTGGSGLVFRHRSTDWLARYRRYGGRFPTFSGGGATAGDLDGDGWPDLIFCGADGCNAFVNRHDGTFADVTASAGIAYPGEARMAVLADLDNDGIRDLFLGYVRDSSRLYRGLGGGRFADVTATSGLDRPGEIFGGAVAFDADGDGLLDLFVANFGDYLAKESPWLTRNAQNGMPSRLYHNEGGLHFRDVTAASGIEDTGWTQAVSHVDLDGDGDQDLYLANDYGRNSLWVNRGDGTFESRGKETFLDSPFHGMNVAFADLNRDGHPEIFVTNIWTLNSARGRLVEFNTLLESRVIREGDIRYSYGHMAELSQSDTGWSWGAMFFDADNDGDDDLYVANGLNPYFTFFLERPHPGRPDATVPYNFDRLPNLFYENRDGVFVRLADAGGAAVVDANSRSVVLLDFDRDGDLDLAVSTFHDRPRLFRNDGAPAANHWLELELVGDPSARSPRDGIGARVVARTAAGGYVWRAVCGGEGYMSVNAAPLAFGLGPATAVDLEILWPGGRRQTLAAVPADRAIRIREGSDEPEVLWTAGAP